ncbi:putative Ctf8 [Staphylotrichum tortipilum]|uniref:Ctf8 n=1 Tax=Staphylotrichum tortipilum TaxID=2831512 RepID=A0AAN6RUB2_9PEZI|nr:putative Ctf8 [Staphylotrichum longicolle]
MSSIHPPSRAPQQSLFPNPLPPLLHTPTGLALLELQGTINLPPFPPDTPTSSSPPIPIGRLHFPDYHPPQPTPGSDETGEKKAAGEEGPWMKRVWMYVGGHQRLQGEVKRLPRAVGVLRRRGGGEELEVVEVVRYKVVFSGRPEPVGAGGEGV